MKKIPALPALLLACCGVVRPQKLDLTTGDALMRMTRRVAEAQDAAGQLFGFDRIGEMLSKGAAAAQAFGQEDDITVLTVRSVAA